MGRRPAEAGTARLGRGTLRSSGAAANRLEALKGDRRGQYSIRINDQYRVCFVWTEHGPDHVEIVDYHD
jgi:plasmid maintenance system killer protein